MSIADLLKNLVCTVNNRQFPIPVMKWLPIALDGTHTFFPTYIDYEELFYLEQSKEFFSFEGNYFNRELLLKLFESDNLYIDDSAGVYAIKTKNKKINSYNSYTLVNFPHRLLDEFLKKLSDSLDKENAEPIILYIKLSLGNI